MPAYGRGGAGNILEHQADQERRKDDVEAQEAVVAAIAAEATSLPQYARTGRGGAGNIYSPQELASSGTFVESQTVDSQQQAESQQDPARGIARTTTNTQTIPFVQRMVGRGGAGNYGWSNYEVNEEEDKTAELEAEKKREIEQSVAREVQDELAPPPKAKVPHDVVK